MEPWRRELIEQFPELRHSPESWSLVDAAAKLGGRVEKATCGGDVETIRRVLSYVMWAHAQASHDEVFFQFCVEVLRTTVERERLRSALALSLGEEALLRLAPVFRYLLDEREFTLFQEVVKTCRARSGKRGTFSPNYGRLL